MYSRDRKYLRTRSIAVAIIASILATGCVKPDEERVENSETSEEAALVTADDHGAIIQEAGKENVVTGLDRQSKKVWSQPGHELSLIHI